MARRPPDDVFLAWLSGLTGPLGEHHARLVVGALLDQLRHRSSPEERRLWHAFFYKWWNQPTVWRTSLLYGAGPEEFNRLMAKARQPAPRGRPLTPLYQLREQYARLLEWAEARRAANPGLNEFRRELARIQEAGLTPPARAPIPSARVHGLYRLLEKPERLVLAILGLTTGKSVKTLRQQIRPIQPKRAQSPPPAS
jgi:hypothetical protein